MGNTFKQMIYMKTALWINAFCYFNKRLWIIGKWMPDAVYENYGRKKTLSVLAVLLRLVIEFCGKPVYLFFAVITPLMLMRGMDAEFIGKDFLILVQVIFFLNCVTGSFADGQIFTVTRDKVTCIKYLRVDAGTYLKCGLAFKYIPFFLFYLPWIIFFAQKLGGTSLQGVFLWLTFLSFRFMGEAFQLVFFERTGKVISRNIYYEWGMILIGLAGAYVPIMLNWELRFAVILIYPLNTAIFLLAGCISLWYIIVGYKGYEKNFHRSMDLNFLLSSLLKTSSGITAAFKEVEIREKDAVVSEREKKKFAKLKGYSYFNALFFVRHKRQIIRPVYYRIMVAAAMFAAAAVLRVKNQEAAIFFSKNLAALLPFFVYVMFFMTIADKASRAMFYNCDKDMLHYAFYRQSGTILKNFKIRLLRVAFYDSIIAGAVCLAVIGFCILCGTSIISVDLLLFCVSIFLLSILFTAHHLCLYYILQPYSENLQVKNPFYSVIKIGMYFFCLLCLQIKTGGLLFTIGVLSFTVIYIIGALLLVYYFAPKTFRIK